MKFDPFSLLRLASACGITMKRHRTEHLIVATHKPGRFTQEWQDAVRLHKEDLIKVLPLADPPRRQRNKQEAESVTGSGWKQQDAFDP